VSATRRALVVIPVFGHHDMTHALLGDLDREKEQVDVVIVDNRGDYPRRRDEAVLRPGENLGWAAGTNYGTAERRQDHHTAFIWLNNDTRLAAGFVAGLFRAWESTRAGLVGPFYDCHWLHQRDPARPPVAAYRARRRHYRAPFLDGTCMFVPATTADQLGLLDAETFAPLGWGAEIDYCLRARAAAMEVVVTRLAYLHHERSVTARSVFQGGYDEYLEKAYPVALEGLRDKWGDWQRDCAVDPSTSQTPAVTEKDRVSVFGPRSSR
jgi:GT2 family glycosyltransferase